MLEGNHPQSDWGFLLTSWMCSWSRESTQRQCEINASQHWVVLSCTPLSIDSYMSASAKVLSKLLLPLSELNNHIFQIRGQVVYFLVVISVHWFPSILDEARSHFQMGWSNYVSQMCPVFACALAVHKFPSVFNARWSHLLAGVEYFLVVAGPINLLVL